MSKWNPRALPSNTERNLKEQVNAITLKCGREVETVEEKKEKEKKVENSPKAEIESKKVGESQSPKEVPQAKVVPPVQAYKSKIHFQLDWSSTT